VITVPASFTSRAHKKARALCYSAQLRQALGLDTADVKILYNDDDVQPTKGYIEKAFAADYDICEGITAPRAFYGGPPFGHFLASHIDDMRTRSCLIYCSVFQGLFRKPLHVHGEGLTVTGECERIVGWDHPVVASEDLVFGHNAAHLGMRWGWFCDYVELTSPWSFREFLIQRKRWYWGNVHAITHRDVLPLPRAIPVAANEVFGCLTVLVSVAGLALRFSGHLPPASHVYDVSKIAIASWIAIFAVCGWIDASSRIHQHDDDSRILSAVIAVVMAPVSSLMTVFVIMVSLYQGDPGTFEVIRKTRN
jgi:Glycosyl transferase family group 2